MSPLVGVRERLGSWIGRAAAPVTAWVSAVRRARTFHPDGIVCTAHVIPVGDSPFPELARRLGGPALVRLSAALWKGAPRAFDVLGIAVRFDDAQDLLFATIRSPFTMPFSPLATATRDYLANRYWAVSPFEVADAGRLKFRLSRVGDPPADEDLERDERLRAAVERGAAVWLLEARPVFRRRYAPVARITLDRVADEIDQEALRFDPFRSGLGIVPSGLVHAIRPGAYAGSQRMRPSHD